MPKTEGIARFTGNTPRRSRQAARPPPRPLADVTCARAQWTPQPAALPTSPLSPSFAMPPPCRLTMRNAGQHVAVDACESTVCAPTSADQSPRLAPAAAARRAHDAASTTPSRSPSPSRCFRQQFLHVRCRSPPGSSPQHRPSSHAAIFLRTRALPSTARFPHDFLAHSAAFTAEPPGVPRVLAAGPPLAAACTCSRALRLLGSSARPRLRLLRALHSADMSLSVFLSKSRGGATHRSCCM